MSIWSEQRAGSTQERCGLAGHDLILGGTGHDELRGGPGDDVLIGGPGDDLMTGGPGMDIAIGTFAHDRCSAEIALSCQGRH